MVKNLLRISDLTLDNIKDIAELASLYFANRAINSRVLKGRTVVNLFFEDSTRTLASFEIAARSLGANVFTLPVKTSSISKGESIIDMVKTLDAMNSDILVIRHQNSGIIDILAQYVRHFIINAGDGRNEHPTQALADYLVVSNHKKNIKNLKIVICGDVLHSRVARSNIRLFNMFGAKVSLVMPPTLSSKYFSGIESVHYKLSEGIKNADVIMMLRVQKERMSSNFILSEKEYFYLYGLDAEKLLHAKPDALVMHPGPLNRGVEIGDDIADNIILQQAEFGVAVRKAVLHYYSLNKCEQVL